MAATAMPLLTVENYRLLPETGPRFQLIEGELYMAPAPNRYHQDISRNLEYIFLEYLEEHPIGKLYDAPFDVYLDETNVFQPDILFVSEARRGILTEAGAEGAPDFVVEILSPKTARLDLENKRVQYARHGVDELWIIDPKEKTVAIHRFSEETDGPVSIVSEGGSITTRHFPGLEVDTRKVFAE
jgi:Uma2 family endonuclease